MNEGLERVAGPAREAGLQVEFAEDQAGCLLGPSRVARDQFPLHERDEESGP